eukprot:2683456-Karenia_brevis.AAC.1
MEGIMGDLRDSNLETLSRSGRELVRRDQRDVMHVERGGPEYINTRGSRWAPETGRPSRIPALSDRDLPPRPPRPERPTPPTREATPPRESETTADR